MMDEMNVLNAPKKVVDGLTEVFEGLAQMFEGVSDQLELLGADAAPEEDKRVFPVVDQEAPAVSEKKGAAAPHPRKKPIKKTRKVEDASDKLEEPVADSDSDAAADTQPDAENSTGEAEDTAEESFPVDDADALPWGEDTGQEKDTSQKDEPPDKTKQSDKPQPARQDAPAKEKPAVTITKDDITSVIVAKIKKKRDNNEKIGQLLKTYGVAQLSDLPTEKYEAFLADVSQI